MSFNDNVPERAARRHRPAILGIIVALLVVVGAFLWFGASTERGEVEPEGTVPAEVTDGTAAPGTVSPPGTSGAEPSTTVPPAQTTGPEAAPAAPATN